MDVAIEEIEGLRGAHRSEAEDLVGDPMIDLVAARRPDVVRRLIEAGVPARTLRALLPEWESLIRETTTSG